MKGCYTTTSYYFKGGAGRNTALANTTVDPAQRGRRISSVSFDIEAPGFDTFDVLRPNEEVPVLIDFVAQYRESGLAPDAADTPASRVSFPYSQLPSPGFSEKYFSSLPSSPS